MDDGLRFGVDDDGAADKYAWRKMIDIRENLSALSRISAGRETD
jgi:hypothetical protein